MKQTLVRMIRAIVPMFLLRGIETFYRVVRIHFLSLVYGYPARSLKVIAITGTNGKTTTANYINEIIKASGQTTAMFSTATIEINGKPTLNDLNATVGTTKRMQQFFKQAKLANVDYVVMEFPSHALDQHKLDLVPVDTAIMTNLTQDHLDYHKTMEAYAAAKARLFKKHPRVIVLNKDDEWFSYYDQFAAKQQKLTYAIEQDADFYPTEVQYLQQQSEVLLHAPSQPATQIHINLAGKYNLANVLAAAACAQGLGIAMTAIAKGVAALTAVPGRFEVIKTEKPYTIVVDYAHTPDGLEKFLSSVQDTTEGKVHLVFGSCGDRDKGKRPIMGEIASRFCDYVYVTDEESYSEDPAKIRRDILEGITDEDLKSGKVQEIADRKAAIRAALQAAQAGDAVLVTGLGHEIYRIMGNKKLPWNDSEEIKKILEEL